MEAGERMRITVFDNPGAVIRLHPALAHRLSLRFDSTCDFVFGMKRTPVYVLLDPMVPVDCVAVTPSLRRRFFPNVDVDWLRASLATDKVAIGPLIGILCNPIWKPKQATLQASKQLPGLQKMSEIGRREGAMVCLFGIRDVDFDHHRIRGYVWNGGRWQVTTLPLPDVIYDQVISRKVEQNKAYFQKRERLSELYQGRIFNDGFFDKWQVHEWLTRDKRTRAYVPQTIMYGKTKASAQFLRTHSTTFLKPVHGSLGLGIIRVAQQSDGTLAYDIKHRSRREHGTAISPDSLIESLRSRIAKRPYLMQQGLALARYNERTFDIRIVLQRNGEGDWKRTKSFARVAKSGEFTSNLSSGGEALPVETVLKSVYKAEGRRARCRRTVNRVAFMVTTVIEEQSGKMFGELGVDIGLDENGNVWVIEVNSKPWKRPYTDTGRQDLVDLAFERPIQYAVHLVTKA